MPRPKTFLPLILTCSYLTVFSPASADINVSGAVSPNNPAGWNGRFTTLRVGLSGQQGSISITEGGTNQAEINFGQFGFQNNSPGNLSIDGPTSSFVNTFFSDLGYNAESNLSITNGGTYHSVNGVNVGTFSTGTGNVTISGAGSQFITAKNYPNLTNRLNDLSRIGFRGNANLTISDGGLFTSGGRMQFGIEGTSSANVTVTGTNSKLESANGGEWRNNYSLNLTDNGQYNTSGFLPLSLQRDGVVNLSNGGQINLSANTSSVIFSNEINISTGAQINQTSSSGRLTIGSPSLNVEVSGNGMVKDANLLDINGTTLTLKANAELAAGVYTPFEAPTIRFNQGGTQTAIGGTWDLATRTFTVEEKLDGDQVGVDLSGERIGFGDNGEGNNTLIVGFNENEGVASFSALLTDDQMIGGEFVAGAYDFITDVDQTTLLSFYVENVDGSDVERDQLSFWHQNNTASPWTEIFPEFTLTENGWVSFENINGFSGYAVTSSVPVVPEPTSAALLIAAGMLAAYRRRR